MSCIIEINQNIAVSALDFSGGETPDVGDTVNLALCMTALVTVACGTGGIKPCVSTLGGDQFPDDARGQRQLKDFFSIFYFAINAGSLCSTFITPVLRAQGNYFIAFLVPAILMFIALLLFLAGSKYYTKNLPTGNIFAQFLGATWAAIKGKFKANKDDKRDHFMDYAKDCGKYPTQIINDAKWVFPILVMYSPVPMFWALFDMQGSRWTQSATQMNGQLGSVTILPDQIQLLNALLILVLLPLFQKLIYPAFEFCGIRVTPLRKMSLGQLIAGASFIISGVVQVMIQESLTPIPDYNKDNSLMVTNAANIEMEVSSDFWVNNRYSNYEENVQPEVCNDDMCFFTLISGNRTRTFDWFNDFNSESNNQLSINGETFTINPTVETFSSESAGACSSTNDTFGDSACQTCAESVVKTQLHKITNVVYYEKDGKAEVFQYVSPKEKSGDLKTKFTYVNPTEYFMQLKMLNGTERVSFADGSEDKSKEPYAGPFCAMTNGGSEIENAEEIHFVVELYDREEVLKGLMEGYTEKDYEDTVRKNMNNTEPKEVIEFPNKLNEIVPDGEVESGFAKSGSMWTIMPFKTNDGYEVSVKMDSKPNTVSVLWLIPQYVVITISEVLNSVTGLEFAYSQAPASMKSTVQSFWLLTTCIGNIIVIFLVSVKIGNTQAGEYFILAIIMLVAALIFMLLSIFYYEYVDPESFEADADDEKKSRRSTKSSRSSKSSGRATTTSL